MMSKSVLFVTVVCGCVLQPSGFTQQFRAGRLITLSPNTTSSTFGQVYGIADFNGDGRPDLLVGANNGFGVNVADVLLQNSNGTFMEKTTSVPLGNTVVADVNGDGKADIVTAISAPIDVNHGDPLGPATLVIAYGIGSGAFRMEAPVNLQGGLFVSSLLVEDLNHDGRPDIMVSISDHNEAVIETFLNNGNSTFSPGPVYGTLTGGNLLASGDFNGDGFGDVVVNNNFETQILLGNGHGNFTAGATYNVNAYAAGVGDFNRDHHLDLALVGVKNSVVMLGKGNGTFTTSATLDTAYGTAISNVEFNNPVTPTQIYVGDLNKDGIPDLVVGALSATGVISIYYGKGNGTFNNPKAFNVGGSFASSEHPFAFGDMNRDGHLDVITQTNGHYAIAFGTNDGGLNAPIITQARMAGSIAKGDFNDDGIEDVAVVDEPICSSCTGTTVRVFLGTAHGFMTPPKTYSIPVKWGAIAAGDVNRDGKTDLVVTRNAYMINTNSGRRYTTPDVAVLLGRGDGTFDAPASYTVVGAPAVSTLSDSVYLVDVNHDGKVDLVGDWGAALGNGAGQFGKPIPLPSGLEAITAVAPGDFSNSGKVDLAVAQVAYHAKAHQWLSTSTINTLSGNGSGSFTVTHKEPINGFVNHLISADMNADGTDDVLFTFNSVNGTSNWENIQVDLYRAGVPSFGALNQWLSTFAATGLVVGDFNRDGKMDVAVFDLMNIGADVNVSFGTGNTPMFNKFQYYQGAMNQGVVLDINGDSAPDIAGVTTIGISRLLNTGHK